MVRQITRGFILAMSTLSEMIGATGSSLLASEFLSLI